MIELIILLALSSPIQTDHHSACDDEFVCVDTIVTACSLEGETEHGTYVFNFRRGTSSIDTGSCSGQCPSGRPVMVDCHNTPKGMSCYVKSTKNDFLPVSVGKTSPSKGALTQ